eukprot:11340236-Alexandrium_andersonii.AAC.1
MLATNTWACTYLRIPLAGRSDSHDRIGRKRYADLVFRPRSRSYPRSARGQPAGSCRGHCLGPRPRQCR